MLPEAALLTFYLADPAVSALAEDRGSGVWRKQGTPTPAFTITRTDGAPDYALEGPTGFEEIYLQIDCYAQSAQAAKLLADAIKAASGRVNVGTTQGVVQGAFVYHTADEYEGDQPDRLFRTRLNLRTPSNA